MDRALRAFTAAGALVGDTVTGGDLSNNLLAALAGAARVMATVGGISDALEKVFGRHIAVIRTISGVDRAEAGDSPLIAEVLAGDGCVRRGGGAAAADPGREDGAGRARPWAEVIVTAVSDLGFDVDVGPLFSTPEEVAQQAVDADVHVVGVNSLAAGHLTLVPALKAAMIALGRPDFVVGWGHPPGGSLDSATPVSPPFSVQGPSSRRPLWNCSGTFPRQCGTD